MRKKKNPFNLLSNSQIGSQFTVSLSFALFPFITSLSLYLSLPPSLPPSVSLQLLHLQNDKQGHEISEKEKEEWLSFSGQIDAILPVTQGHRGAIQLAWTATLLWYTLGVECWWGRMTDRANSWLQLMRYWQKPVLNVNAPPQLQQLSTHKHESYQTTWTSLWQQGLMAICDTAKTKPTQACCLRRGIFGTGVSPHYELSVKALWLHLRRGNKIAPHSLIMLFVCSLKACATTE